MADIWPILARYPQAPCNPRVTPVRGGGFSGAGVWRVDTDPGLVCLRQWPVNSLPVARLHELHRFLAFLSSRGVSEVAVPFVSRDGSTLIEHGGRLWQLEPWMPGEADVAARPANARLRSAMQALARLHHAAAEYVATEVGQQWFSHSPGGPSPAVVERLGMIREWTAPRVHVVLLSTLRRVPGMCGADEFARHYGWAAPSVEQELAALAPVTFRLHPCLRDIWRAHVLFEADAVTGIIDPSATRSENVASDLSRLIGSLVADDHTAWEYALSTYAEVRPLDDAERRLVRALDRSSVLLSGLAWLERAPRLDAATQLEALARFHWITRRLRVLAESVGHL